MDERLKIVGKVKEALLKIENSTFENRSEYQILMNDVEDCLLVLCSAGIAQINFTQEEKLELGIMVKKALPAIGLRVSHIVSGFPPRGLHSSKIERSGLQFLFDEYKDFPVFRNEEDPSVLSEAFSDFKAEEDVEGWDNYLECQFVDYFDPTIDIPPLSGVPSTHWWFHDIKS